jgi:hypothetical protein
VVRLRVVEIVAVLLLEVRAEDGVGEADLDADAVGVLCVRLVPFFFSPVRNEE